MKDLKDSYSDLGYGKKSVDELRNTFIQYMNTDMHKRAKINQRNVYSVFIGWRLKIEELM